jgi:hypothetical protein
MIAKLELDEASGRPSAVASSREVDLETHELALLREGVGVERCAERRRAAPVLVGRAVPRCDEQAASSITARQTAR